MSWWSKDKPEPVRADTVRDLIKLGMRETDAADRDINSPEFDAAKRANDLRGRTASKAELTAAHEALRRHGY